MYFAPAIFISNSARAVAGPDDVGMRVHQAGQHRAAAGIQTRLVGIGPQQVRRGPDGQDGTLGTLPDQDSPIFEQAQAAEQASALRAAG